MNEFPRLAETQGAIVETDPTEAFVGFYSMDDASTGILSRDFDIKEEFRSIIDLVRHPDPRIKLQAHRQFRSMLREVASANGLVGRATEVREISDGQGNRITQSRATNLLTNRLRRSNERERSITTGNLSHHPSALSSSESRVQPADADGPSPTDALGSGSPPDDGGEGSNRLLLEGSHAAGELGDGRDHSAVGQHGDGEPGVPGDGGEDLPNRGHS
jgi:hypothetical protein